MHSDPNGVMPNCAGDLAQPSDPFFFLSLDLLCVAGYDGYFKDLNPRWQQVFGYGDEELKARPFIEFVHPDDLAATQREVGQLFEGRQTIAFENRYRAKDGSYKWLSWNAILVPERDAIYATARDITDRKEMEATLRRSEAQYRHLVETSRDLIWSVDAEGRWTFLNRAAKDIYGWDPEQMIGRSFFEVLPPERVERDAAAFGEILAGQTYFRYETRHMRRDGTPVDLIFNATALRDDAGRVREVLGTATDVSELRRREAQFNKMAVNVPGTIYQFKLDPDGTASFPYISSGCRDLFEFDPEDLMRDAALIIDLIHPDDREEFDESVAQSAQSLEPWQWEGRFILASGKLKWIQGASRPERQPDGAIVWDGLLMDISDRKQAEENLKRSQQKLSLHFQQSPLAVIEWSLTFEVTEWNPAAEDIFGYSRQEALGCHPAGLIVPESARSHVDRIWNELLQQTGGHRSTNENQTRDGRTIVCEWYNTPLIDADGQTVGVMSLVQDVTERQRAEIALKQLNEELELRVEQRTQQLKDAIDQLRGEVRERQRTVAALQASEQQLRQQAQRERLLNQLSDRIRNSLEVETILETTVREIYQLLGVDRAQFIWYRPNGVAQGDGDDPIATHPVWEVVNEAKVPEAIGFLGCHSLDLLEPLTEKLLALETICLERRHAFDSWPVKRFMRRVGCRSLLAIPIKTRSEAIGALSCSRWRTEAGWSESEVQLFRAIADQLAIAIDRAELYDQTRQSAATAQARAQQLETALAELQQTQAQLIQTEKMSSLGQMVAGVAHEINNPANFIHGNLSHLKDYTHDLLDLIDTYGREISNPSPALQDKIEEVDLEFLSEDMSKLLDSMKMGSDRIRKIVLSLRNFSRLDESEMKEANLHEGIDNTLLILQHRLKPNGDRPGIKVVKSYGDLPLVECYPSQLNQVFMNLINNAIDVLEEGGAEPRIHIRTSMASTRSVAIQIADNGPGMSESVRDRLFDPFFTTKKVGKGTGLGLSISYQIVVQKHGGQLSCLSQPGRGAKFMVEIPIQQIG